MRGIQAFFRRNRRVGETGRRGSAAAQTLALLLSALALPLAACNASIGGQAGSASLAQNQSFTWPYVTSTGQFGHNEIMDPALIAALKDTGTASLLNIGLVTFNPAYQVTGDGALNWDVDPTGTIYTFHLRPNLTFSDGNPITATDFAYSIDRALDPNLCPRDSKNTYYSPDPQQTRCFWLGPTYLGMILNADARVNSTSAHPPSVVGTGDDPSKGVDVIDSRTLKIRLQKPYSYFLEALTYSTADVLDKTLVENPAYAGGVWVDHLDNLTVPNKGGTSGPFMLKSNDGTKMTFVPNPGWEKAFGPLTIKQIIRPAIASTDSEYSNYVSGAFDYTDVPGNKYSTAVGQTDFHHIPALETDYFGLNTQLAPFDNLNVRQAFDLALNKQAMVDKIESGAAIPSNHIVPQGMPGFFVDLANPAPDNTQSLTGNTPAALSLMRAAQATCATPSAHDYCPYIAGPSPKEIDLYTPMEDSTRIQLATFAAAWWSKYLSVNVVVKPISFDVLVGYISLPAAESPASLWSLDWIADYPDPQDWLSLQFTSPPPPGPNYASNNSEGYSSPALDKQMANADVEQDSAKRMQMYNQVEQAVVNQCLWIPFQQKQFLWRVRTYVHGFGFNPGGLMVDINWTKVYIAQH